MKITNICLLTIFFLIAGCSLKSEETKINSFEIFDREDRVSALKEFVVLKSEIIDAEFDLFNVSGFGNSRTIPGASSFDYKMAIKTEDTESWIVGLDFIETTTKREWMNDLTEVRRELWNTFGNCNYYRDSMNNVEVYVFPMSHILFKGVKAL